MTNSNTKLSPPPELVGQWYDYATAFGNPTLAGPDYLKEIADRSAQWGADQELEACCEWLDYNCPSVGAHHLRASRRPKPPSLKEQALNQLTSIQTDLNKFGMGISTDTIRRAIEALPDD